MLFSPQSRGDGGQPARPDARRHAFPTSTASRRRAGRSTDVDVPDDASPLVTGLPVEPVVASVHGGNYQQCWGQPWTDTTTLIPQLGPWECAAAPWFMNSSQLDKVLGRVGTEVVEAHRHQAARAHHGDADRRRRRCPTIHERRRLDLVPRLRDRQAGARAHVVLPELEGARRVGPVPRRAELHGRRADEPRREAHLRADRGRLARPDRDARSGLVGLGGLFAWKGFDRYRATGDPDDEGDGDGDGDGSGGGDGRSATPAPEPGEMLGQARMAPTRRRGSGPGRAARGRRNSASGRARPPLP